MRTTANDYSVPQVRDELRYVVRHELMQNTAKDTLTIRNNPSQEALPMRRLGSFLPGEAVGGSGVHWSGHTWRWTDMEFKVRSLYEERYGKSYIPADMTSSSPITISSNTWRRFPAKQEIFAVKCKQGVTRSKRRALASIHYHR